MAVYIDRNRLIKKFCNHCYFDIGEKNCAEDCYDMKIIKSLPIEDVQPVKHGKWELAEDGWYCTACKLYPPFDCDPEEKGILYCPNCGARMDGE